MNEKFNGSNTGQFRDEIHQNFTKCDDHIRGLDQHFKGFNNDPERPLADPGKAI